MGFERFGRGGELYDPAYRWSKLLLKGLEGLGELYDPSYRWSKLLLRGLEGLESSTTLHIGGTNSF